MPSAGSGASPCAAGSAGVSALGAGDEAHAATTTATTEITSSTRGFASNAFIRAGYRLVTRDRLFAVGCAAMIHTLAVAGYRSLRELLVPLGQLTLITGANGSGKSSLYRAVRLLAETSTGGAIASLAAEGG